MISASYSYLLLVALNSQLTASSMMSPYGDFNIIRRFVPLKLEDQSVKIVHLPMVSSLWSSFLSNSASGCIPSLKLLTKSTSACDFIVDLYSYLLSYVLSFMDHFSILPHISGFRITFLMQ